MPSLRDKLVAKEDEKLESVKKPKEKKLKGVEIKSKKKK